MVYHIINAPIRSPMTIVAARHQYDYGQALSITGITLPDVFEAHFASVDGSQTVTMLGHDGVVEVPDELFQVAKAIICYIYLHDETTDGRTVYTIKIPVKERPEPSDVEPTPVQQDIITQAIAALNDAVTQTGQDVISADASAQAASESAESANASASRAVQSEVYATAMADAARQSASKAAALAFSASQSAASAHASESSAQVSATYAARDADRAEQAAGQSGYMFFHIDSNGDLIYERTSNVDVDFRLVDGDLYMKAV